MMIDVCIQFGSFEMFQTNFRQVQVFSWEIIGSLHERQVDCHVLPTGIS